MCRGDRDQLALGLLDIWGQPYSILCGTNQLAGRLSSWYMHGGGRTGRGGVASGEKRQRRRGVDSGLIDAFNGL